ncbi:MAG: iron-containing alcohol dehydrogenase, partial [Duncaniella sp.]|nr:iron-containing alcohol dehydrogenase [Duncaniella sp.]
MDNFSFYTPTRYKFGRGTENLVGEMSASQGWETVMIVYGGGSAIRSGLLERVCKSLTRAGVKFVTFGGILPNPTDGPVREAIDTVSYTHLPLPTLLRV